MTNFLKYLMSRLTKFKYPQDDFDQLQQETNVYAQKLEVAEEPATRTKVNVAEKNVARKTLESHLRKSVAEYLIHNHLLSQGDLELLGLPVHKTTRTPAPVASEAPASDVDTSVIGRITINFYEKGSPHKKAKPAGQHCVETVWIISDTPITRWDALIHSSVDTNSPLTLVFENDQRGQTIYFALRWENTRGEKGPWSEIQSAIIP
jgi:hypothetical protein